VDLDNLAAIIIGGGLGALASIPLGYLIVYLIRKDDIQEEVEAISPDTIIIISEDK